MMRTSNILRDRLTRTAALLSGALLPLASGPASAFAAQSNDGGGTARVQALLRDGQWIDGRLERMDSARCTIARSVAGGDRAAGDIDRGQVVACLIGAEGFQSLAFLTQMSAGTVVFADGQLLPGTLRSDSRPPRWEHRWIGAIPLKTDAISEIRLSASQRAPSRPDSDAVLLLNGDIVFGFIDSIGDEVVVEMSGESATVAEPPSKTAEAKDATQPPQQSSAQRRIQIDRVAAMTFAALDQPSVDGSLLWTADGTIVRARDIGFDPEVGWRFTLADQNLAPQGEPKSVTSAVAKPTALLLDDAALTPLAACGAPEHRPSEGSYRYQARPETRIEPSDQSLLGLGSIEFDGPCNASFRLPSALVGSEVAFSAEIALIEPVPVDARVAVTVRFAGTEGETLILDAKNRGRPVRLRQQVGADAALEVLVEDGGNGIAGDRIAVNRACFIRQR